MTELLRFCTENPVLAVILALILTSFIVRLVGKLVPWSKPDRVVVDNDDADDE